MNNHSSSDIISSTRDRDGYLGSHMLLSLIYTSVCRTLPLQIARKVQIHLVEAFVTLPTDLQLGMHKCLHSPRLDAPPGLDQDWAEEALRRDTSTTATHRRRVQDVAWHSRLGRRLSLLLYRRRAGSVPHNSPVMLT